MNSAVQEILLSNSKLHMQYFNVFLFNFPNFLITKIKDVYSKMEYEEM